MRYELLELRLRDRLLIASRRAGLLIILLVFAAAIQLVWEWEKRERTMWTFVATCLFLLFMILLQARRPAPTGYLELADGIMTHRHNGVEYVVRLVEVSEGTIFSVFGNHSIFLKLSDGRFDCELDQYSKEVLHAFTMALGPRLKRGGIIDYLKLLFTG